MSYNHIEPQSLTITITHHKLAQSPEEVDVGTNK